MKDCLGMTALHLASRAGHADCLEVIMDNLGAINEPSDDGGSTPLHLAAASGHVECLQILVRNGADLDKTDGQGRSAIQLAKNEDCKQACTMLTPYRAVNSML